MNHHEFINLYIYSDSLAFRRLEQAQDISFTYPFKLKELIEDNLGIRTNLVMRGSGAADIRHIQATLVRDSGYFGGDSEAINIAILQFGIVDCAPRPITYLLAPALRNVPIIGQKILSQLVKHRRGLQTLCSYTVTSKARFKREYAKIVRTCHAVNIRPIAVGLPLPTLSIEQRSPGFRRNVSIYNRIIQDVIPDSFCDIDSEMTETMREEYLLSDGHHLSERGHRFYAEKLFKNIQKQL